jgi:hypothetical protein
MCSRYGGPVRIIGGAEQHGMMVATWKDEKDTWIGMMINA